MHALVLHNNVVAARGYDKGYFEMVMGVRYNVSVSLPENIVSTYQINDNFKILPVKQLLDPPYNAKTQVLAGPRYLIYTTHVESQKYTVDKSIDALKNELKANVANARWEKETAGFDLGNGTIIRTDAESQAKISGAYNFMQLKNNAEIDWKGANGWMKLKKADIEAVATAVAEYVQACFSKEKQLNDVIDACTTLQELDELDITFTLE
jgi:hypothetical protein